MEGGSGSTEFVSVTPFEVDTRLLTENFAGMEEIPISWENSVLASFSRFLGV